MNSIKISTWLYCALFIIQVNLCSAQANFISMKALLAGLQQNNDLLKAFSSEVESKQSAVKQANAERIPHINTMYQATLGSDNNVIGSYLPMGLVPSLVSGTRSYSDVGAVAGNTAYAGVDWEAVNFGAYKAQKDFALSDLAAQNKILAKYQFDLSGMASAYYLELLRQHDLEVIDRDNVARLGELLINIKVLVKNGIRPGVDSSVASAELSKAIVALYQSQKAFAQTQEQIAALTRLTSALLLPDTNVEPKLIDAGPAFIAGTRVDTLNHPEISMYASFYDLSLAKLNLDKKRYYPRVFLDADAWTRGSSISSAGDYENLSTGYAPQRFNYFVGLTLAYDLMNIVHKKFSSDISKFQAEASAHRLQQARTDLSSEFRQSVIESEYQLRRLNETKHQLRAAEDAYRQQSNLYRNGLSSIIELDLALSYYIEARKDFAGARIGYIRSVLNYSLVTNTFNLLVQTFNL